MFSYHKTVSNLRLSVKSRTSAKLTRQVLMICEVVDIGNVADTCHDQLSRAVGLCANILENHFLQIA